MSTSSANPSPIPTQNPGPDGRIAPIVRHNNRHGIPGHLWWMLYYLARADGKSVFMELVRACEVYGAIRGVFAMEGYATGYECKLCGGALGADTVSLRLLKRKVVACNACIVELDRGRAEYIRSLKEGADGETASAEA